MEKADCRTDTKYSEKVQQATFTNWVKETLNAKEHDIDLKGCFKDGLMLIALLNTLPSPEKIRNYFKQPQKKAHMIDNIAVCFKFMKSENIKIVNICELL